MPTLALYKGLYMSKSPEKLQNEHKQSIEISDSAAKRLEDLQNKVELSAENFEQNVSSRVEKSLNEAREVAASTESGSKETNKDKPTINLNRHRLINKKMLNESYAKTLSSAQEELKPGERIFSKIIHNKPTEAISGLIGSTIARPNAILSGAVTSFVLTLSIYAVAKTIGYKLSGFEPILAFILGWIIGIIYDYFRMMISGKKD